MSKVLVGMSGGVDSTAAALLLKKKGHEVIGVTLSLWDEASRCCNIDDIMEAKKAAARLKIKHYTLNMKKEFRKLVVEPFIDSYLAGKTPNPCAICNERIKFAALLNKMRELECGFIATGHYARVEKRGKEYLLKKGVDAKKSQEYFLARLDKAALPFILFPLGGMKKERVKKLLSKAGFNASKKESQEACFIPDKKTPYEFIEENRDVSKINRGELYSSSGTFIKPLDYAYYKYTVGQRKGLNYSAGKPVFVTRIEADKSRVYAGEREECVRKDFKVSSLNMLYNIKGKGFSAGVKIRYLHKPAPARVEIKGDSASVAFKEGQFAVTPGQLAVFYRGKTVIGSGYIENE